MHIVAGEEMFRSLEGLRTFSRPTTATRLTFTSALQFDELFRPVPFCLTVSIKAIQEYVARDYARE